MRSVWSVKIENTFVTVFLIIVQKIKNSDTHYSFYNNILLKSKMRKIEHCIF